MATNMDDTVFIMICDVVAARGNGRIASDHEVIAIEFDFRGDGRTFSQKECNGQNRAKAKWKHARPFNLSQCFSLL